MKCPVCGTENLDGVSFCAGCGGSLSSVQNGMPQGGMSPQPPVNNMGMMQPGGQMPMGNGAAPSPLGGMTNIPVQQPYVNQQPYPNQQQYMYQQPVINNGMYGQPPVNTGSNVTGLGIAGMICGIVSLVFYWFPIMGILIGLVASVLSAIDMASHKTRSSGMAIAGFVCGILAIVFSITCWVTCGSPINCYGAL